MESNHKGYRETSPLLNPRHTGIYSRSLSQEEAILGVSNNYSRFHQRYRLYGWRWYVLLVLFVLNVSNAMLWLSFAPIADLSALYYKQSLDAINWLSIVFLICYLLFGLPTMWILDVLGLRTGILLGAWLNGIGAVVRILSGMEFVPPNLRFLVVVIGQTLAALAQPFLLCAPTKLAGVWFGANERGTANMIASLSNPVGVMIANVLAPAFVTKKSNIPQMLKYFSIPALLGIAMATLGVCSSTPPTPPTASAEAKSEPFFLGLRKVLRNKAFFILMVAFGSGVGLFTCMTTLLEQIICPRGYDDKLAGIAGAVLIAVGLAGGALSGFYIDKTKKFEEAAKMSFGCATISCCVVTIVTSFSGLPVLLISSCGLFGFFAFALMPVCLEVGVECTYPVAEATSAGLQWMAGQATGIVFILICQVLEVPRKLKDSKCLKKTEDGKVADFKFAMYFMSAAAVAMAILLICTFKPTYKRLEMERKKEATRILNTETSQQRLPDIPDSSSDIS
ncbi:solute carrier family 49 member A3-like [Acropora millepora]|uniref:solute carrier family 49 member A3-like n=1 Tax=Acropora millepora TaxID=45264 RepID=UPI001CF382F6|nr:solute carrier family 49 member A3-like [Acropora millepora]